MVRAVFLISLLFSPRLVLSFVRLSSRAARSVLALRNFSLKQGVCRRDWLFCLQCGRWCGGGGVQDKKKKRGKESAFFPSKGFFWGGRFSFWFHEVLSKRPLFQKRGLNSHSLLASLFRSWLVQAWSKGKGKRRHKKGRKKKALGLFSLFSSLFLSSQTDARRLVDVEPVAPLVPLFGVSAQGRSRADLKGPGAGSELGRRRRAVVVAAVAAAASGSSSSSWRRRRRSDAAGERAPHPKGHQRATSMCCRGRRTRRRKRGRGC